jgi:hypothetical protein
MLRKLTTSQIAEWMALLLRTTLTAAPRVAAASR